LQAQIAERKRAEETYEKAQEYTESIVETIREPLIVLTSDLEVISANRSFYETFQVAPEETEGRFIFDVGNHQWDIPALRELLEEIIPQNTHLNNFEVDHTFPHIGRKRVLLNARRIYWKGKGTDRILLAFEDITDQKQTEEALKSSEKRYRRLFETAQDGILILDAETGQISDVNPFLVEMLGYLHEDFLGKKLWGIGAFKDIEASKATFLELQSKGYVRYNDLPLETKDGRHIDVEFVSNVYLVNHKKVIQCNIRDITKRKQAEEELKKRTAQLEAANKELESFSYSVSHDLRVPLRAIDGFSRMILKKQGDNFDEDTLSKFNVIRSNAQMMGHLIDDLLAFSRLGRKQISMSKIDMDQLVRDVWKELQAINPDRNMELTLNGVLPGYGDEALIKQVYFNLLYNAFKFTKHRDAAYIEAGGYTDRNEDVYYVKDNGVGFDMAYYDKLFGVFQRLRNADDFEGTGVGLAIVQRIIHRHGGRLWAEGKVNEGATFYFTLPHYGDRLIA
jgi:PAS domain S-box-containing protein